MDPLLKSVARLKGGKVLTGYRVVPVGVVIIAGWPLLADTSLVFHIPFLSLLLKLRCTPISNR